MIHRILALAIIVAIACHASAQPAGPGTTAENAPAQAEITQEMGPAIVNAFDWLKAQQNTDGSFGGGRYGRHVGITALACLAYLSDGHMPGRGQYGDVVDKGLEFVLNNVNETGLVAADTSHGPMYGHGFATLFLGEIYGMTAGGPNTQQANRLHNALIKAVRLIVQTQNPEGGWRYNPVPYDADLSVTICQIMALRSARNAGIEVPSETIDKAIEYVRKCQNPDGGFKYQLTSGGSAWPRSAAGIASLYYAGIYEDKAIEEGLEYLTRTAFPGRRRSQGAHYFYGHYYAVQTMYLAGGEHWAKWWPAVRAELLEKQLPDGSWSDNHAGSSYGTAMALIILQMPKRYLPIFQK
jgi:Prenyltransferase and squalene oxidase repeat